MKTLKQFKSEVIANDVLENIMFSYSAKMGGTRELIVNGEQLIKQDDREYYSGRGARYNSNINHDIQVYNLTQKEYDAEVAKIAQKEYDMQKMMQIRRRTDRMLAKGWQGDIDIFLDDVKRSWHYGVTRVWHNVIPCGDDTRHMNYLKNQLRNWLLYYNRYQKLGFAFYENDYNYSDNYFLSSVENLNKNNPDVWAIFDRELGDLKPSQEKINKYYE